MSIYISKDFVPVFIKVAILLRWNKTYHKKCYIETDDNRKIRYSKFSFRYSILAHRSWVSINTHELTQLIFVKQKSQSKFFLYERSFQQVLNLFNSFSIIMESKNCSLSNYSLKILNFLPMQQDLWLNHKLYNYLKKSSNGWDNNSYLLL